MMKKKGIRHLLVTDNGKLRGIVTDRDFRLMRPSPATSLSIYEVHHLLDKVKEIMTKKPITVAPETPIADAARLLLNRRIGALPVLKDEKVVGIIHRDGHDPRPDRSRGGPGHVIGALGVPQ